MIKRFRGQLGVSQVCTLFGAMGGSNQTPGTEYLRVGYGLNVDDLWSVTCLF